MKITVDMYRKTAATAQARDDYQVKVIAVILLKPQSG